MQLRLAVARLIAGKALPALSPPDGSTGGWGGWWPVVRESFPGAWQQNVEVRPQLVLAYHAVFACITLITNDVGKLRFKLLEQLPNGVWEETESPSFSPFLRHPNHYQNPLQFRETWTTSKLRSGNTYALKERDQRGVVVAAYVLDPCRVKPLVAPDGAVFYELHADNLSDIGDTVTVPQSEIFHDRMNCLFHPLVGLSPIFACGLPAMQGLAAQQNSTAFFQNMSRPGGILVAPGPISQPKAQALQAQWNAGFSGANSGKVAVIGDGLKYQPLAITAQEAQMIEQLKWTAEAVCACFHVPAFKVGLGTTPTYQNAEVLNQIYYTDCLQSIIEQMETCLDYGLGLDEPKEGRMMQVELDLDQLLRMDSATQVETLTKASGGAILTPDEARIKVNKRPLPGGDTLYRQQQDFSLAALNERDQNAPFAKPAPAAAPTPQQTPTEDPADAEDAARSIVEPLLARIGELSEATRQQIASLPPPPDLAPVLTRLAALETAEDPSDSLADYLQRELIHAAG